MMMAPFSMYEPARYAPPEGRQALFGELGIWGPRGHLTKPDRLGRISAGRA